MILAIETHLPLANTGTGTAIGGHDQTYLASNAGMRLQTATRHLTLGSLAAGQTYQLFATWTADGDRATNAAYTVSGGRAVTGGHRRRHDDDPREQKEKRKRPDRHNP